MEIDWFERGSFHISPAAARRFYVLIISKQKRDSRTICILYPYIVRTVPFFLVQNDASFLFINIAHVTEIISYGRKYMKRNIKTNRVVCFILLKSLGEAVVDKTVTMDEMREALDFVCQDA